MNLDILRCTLRAALRPLVSDNIEVAMTNYMHAGNALELIVSLGKLFAKSLAGGISGVFTKRC